MGNELSYGRIQAISEVYGIAFISHVMENEQHTSWLRQSDSIILE